MKPRTYGEGGCAKGPFTAKGAFTSSKWQATKFPVGTG